MIDAFAEWAAADGPPNGVFTVALLTHASVWTPAMVRLGKRRLGLDVDDDAADGEDVDDGGSS